MVKYVWKLHENKASTSGKVRGYRLRLAHANLEGSAFGYPVPSFAKRFLIAESGDYSTKSRAEEQLDTFLRETPMFLNIKPEEVLKAEFY